MEFDPIDLESNLNHLGLHCLNDRRVREFEVIGLESKLFAHMESLQYHTLGL